MTDTGRGDCWMLDTNKEDDSVKKLIRVVTFATVLATLTLTGGCAVLLVGAAIGAGTVAYVQGELRSADEVTFDRGWKAVLGAMDELQFKVTKTEKDAVSGEIDAKANGDKNVVIKLRREGDRVTEFRIRVGVFGDEGLSRLIQTKIKQHY